MIKKKNIWLISDLVCMKHTDLISIPNKNTILGQRDKSILVQRQVKINLSTNFKIMQNVNNSNTIFPDIQFKEKKKKKSLYMKYKFKSSR